MFSSSHTISPLHIITLSVPLSLSQILSYTHTHTHRSSFLPVSYFLTDCSDLECETQLCKEYTSVRTNRPDSESNMRENGQNNHILKPSLIPSTYKIVSAPQPRIWSHICIPPNSSSGKSHSWLHIRSTSKTLKKKRKWPDPPHHSSVRQSVCILKLLQMLLKLSQRGRSPFLLEIFQVCSTLLDLHAFAWAFNSVQNSLSPCKC